MDGVADTVMVSHSKGLGAPVGLLLAGGGEHMRSAWRLRRLLVRRDEAEPGILAAAGMYALVASTGATGGGP